MIKKFAFSWFQEHQCFNSNHGACGALVYVCGNAYTSGWMASAHTMTNSLMTVILLMDILFIGFSLLVRVRPTRSCFDLASQFNPALIWLSSYIRGCELFVGAFLPGSFRSMHCAFNWNGPPLCFAWTPSVCLLDSQSLTNPTPLGKVACD